MYGTASVFCTFHRKFGRHRPLPTILLADIMHQLFKKIFCTSLVVVAFRILLHAHFYTNLSAGIARTVKCWYKMLPFIEPA